MLPVMFGPNISGRPGQTQANADVSGAFYTTGSQIRGDFDADGNRIQVAMSASRSSSVFGSSDCVQPSSLRLIHCIKF